MVESEFSMRKDCQMLLSEAFPIEFCVILKGCLTVGDKVWCETC